MTPPNAELLRSLGKLARGLSALFWGLPASLIVCAETARIELLKPVGIVPALVVNALLLFGLWQMGDFQKQERPWRTALDRAKLLGLVNLGLSPFLFFENKMPEQLFFRAAVFILVLSALLFLFNLNIVLKQLGDMLPDETLRQETRQFTLLNRWLFMLLLFFITILVCLPEVFDLPAHLDPKSFFRIEHIVDVVLVILPLLGLAALAITMALIWKTKETILDSVFGSRH